MIRWQAGLCPVCGESLAALDPEQQPMMHVHHLVPKSRGGSSQYDNLMVVHSDCHDLIHGKRKISRQALIDNLILAISKANLNKQQLSEIRWGSGKYPLGFGGPNLTESHI